MLYQYDTKHVSGRSTYYIGLIIEVFTYGLGDRGPIPGWVIPKTLKMVLDADLFNTQPNKVRINGKVEQSREWSNVLLYTAEL